MPRYLVTASYTPEGARGVIGSGGGSGRVETVVLLTPEEIDAAARRTVAYRPPGS